MSKDKRLKRDRVYDMDLYQRIYGLHVKRSNVTKVKIKALQHDKSYAELLEDLIENYLEQYLNEYK